MAKKLNFQESLTRIKDTESDFSTGALYALSNMEPENQAKFEAAWPLIEVERRRRVVAAVIELAEDDIELDFNLPYFFMLSDLDPLVRGKAIDGLWEDESRELLAKLLDILAHDPDEFVREKAALGLSRFALLGETGKLKERWTTRLREGLLAVPPKPLAVARRALEALGYFGQDEIVLKAIERAYTSDDELLKASALKAMGRSVNKRWLPEVGKELSSPDPALRYEAVQAAGEMGSDELLQPVIELTNDRDLEVQLAAIWSLGQIGGPEAQRTLKNVQESDRETLVNAANDALAELTYSANPLNVLGNG